MRKALTLSFLFLCIVPLHADTDRQVRQEMISASIARYPGNCPCPYFTDRRGRRCGGRSAYSRPGGASPLCYESDISDEDVSEYRKKR